MGANAEKTKAPAATGASQPKEDYAKERGHTNRANDERSQAPTIKQRLDWLDHAHEDPRVSRTDFHVLYGVARHINRAKGYAWPSQERLAKLAGVVPRTVQRSIDQLVSFGYLHREVHRGGRGRGPDRSNNYRIRVLDGAAPASQCDTHVALTDTGDTLNATPMSRGNATPMSQEPLDLNPLNRTHREGSLRSPLALSPDVFNGKEDAAHGGQDLSDSDRPSFGEKPLSKVRRRPHRGPTPLAPDWQPNDAGWSHAMKRAAEMGLGRDPDRIDLELEKFRSYYIGNDKHRVNWDAAWHSWWLREEYFPKRSESSRQEGPSAADIILSGVWPKGRAA